MQPLPKPLEMKSLLFNSAEQAFAASKYGCLRPDTDPEKSRELMQKFAVGGVYGDIDPKAAKKMANKAAFTRQGVELDVEKWNVARFDVMKKIVEARVAVDPLFVEYLRSLRGVRGVRDVHIFHSESARFKRPEGTEKEVREAYAKKLVWGATFCGEKPSQRSARGGNAYGEILMAVELPPKPEDADAILAFGAAEAERIKTEESLKRAAARAEAPSSKKLRK